MCGIIAYVGARKATQALLTGLERLEYRGYDSAGVCLLEEGQLRSVRSVGSLRSLRSKLAGRDSSATIGIGHTRWATHGRVTVENAHPLTACRDNELAVVLNGIIENFQDLRTDLEAQGHVFRSTTDAETVAHLVERHYEGDLAAAVQAAQCYLEGHFAFVALHRDHPSLLVGMRRECPLVVGIGNGEMYLASMIAAFLPETRFIKLIEDDEVVVVTPQGARLFAASGGRELSRDLLEVDWDDETAQKQGYETFMLKEIWEQPEAVARTIAARTQSSRLANEELGLTNDELRACERLVVVACGSAYHAGVVGRYAVEEWARMPCEVDIASEWRYRNPILSDGTLVIGVTQSGETADTLAALRLARGRGARTLAITNMMGTQVTREADAIFFLRAGLETGVAATKTFTAQVAAMYLLALRLAEARQTLPSEAIAELLLELRSMPQKMQSLLDGDPPIREIAEKHYHKPFFLYLGRQVGLPVCLEGALKLKEIAYIPTEAYSAGEMKHGPIALLGESTPVVCVATDSHVYDKILSNIQEVRARGAQVIAIATDGNEAIQHLVDDVVYVPRTHPFLQAMLAVIPLQLLALEIAQLRGLDVDRPRNLAKTVTVE
jgi:glucosamine--fructose-6-phosphate aminotransferase (isomerizing)